MKKHRNSQKRIYIKNAVYFLTVNTKNRTPFFKEPIFCELFVENLRICKKLKQFKLYSWFLGWEHLHLLVQPSDEFNYSKVMFSIKKQFSHDANRIIGFNKPYPSPNADKRLSAFGRKKLYTKHTLTIRHQEYVGQLKSQFFQKYPNCHLFPKFRWQHSFRDHVIRNDKDFNTHWEYIKYNPEKHKMPKNWPYIFTNSKYKDLIDKFIL